MWRIWRVLQRYNTPFGPSVPLGIVGLLFTLPAILFMTAGSVSIGMLFLPVGAVFAVLSFATLWF
ncbi:hypothetical protein COV28_00910 [candidate division WWE3 bacterium CG10_big_fil_rev_8_21_14_0_10_48_23]|uniref:Uncharacterized protein n=1 Tax=candidate division WWE3 bacterium CG_4_9_14_0_2_um_filter_48_10 TaxID=1975078 RepID=A0A2M8EJQ0_UNCKA|nr:MAG: hypothetical protein CO059_01065 [candidate division WWE3 bacterium CG_4_9_14_0_2_um_filter_48_10]PJE52173.1 MAG: hypothetical protein COV28_00910 [candidate division WWE3 bacterium CG10_big_fil_rev_8_21_14_0_10_48_23]